ncbi:H-type lectin domain-containing protein [Flavimaricola marinus]|uniref:H-type lectin domain protein n=1 Tax=Flavimaricola marinus TaxID=1819565 RepID=A0A238L967_9RHOB|nr:H-type lectin domain-containing protein [Flavimaricola marinus]SMY05954.1 H-type lectin domain protein [Flavimaricola marinus]
MRRISRHAIGIENGDTVLFSDFERDGEMWTGSGQRQTRVYVEFSESFRETPMVHVGFSMWDVSNSANARMEVQAQDITEKGFAILFRTWADTQVARVRVGWMAIGAVTDEDDWELY